MDNLTLIRRYITKNYDIIINDNIIIRDINTNVNIKLDQLALEASEIFDYDCTKICGDWYNARLRQKTTDIHEYLDNYRVDLGNINWVVLDKHNNEFQIRDMVKHFADKYGEKFIRQIQNDWYIEKIYKNTEDRLKFKLLN